MSLLYVPTRRTTEEESRIIRENEAVFEKHGFRNIAGSGYYQWTKEISRTRNKNGDIKTVELWVEIWSHGLEKAITRTYQPRKQFLWFKWWPKSAYTTKPYKMDQELLTAAKALANMLSKIVCWDDYYNMNGLEDPSKATYDPAHNSKLGTVDPFEYATIDEESVVVDAITPKTVNDFPPERIVINKKER